MDRFSSPLIGAAPVRARLTQHAADQRLDLLQRTLQATVSRHRPRWEPATAPQLKHDCIYGPRPPRRASRTGRIEARRGLIYVTTDFDTNPLDAAPARLRWKTTEKYKARAPEGERGAAIAGGPHLRGTQDGRLLLRPRHRQTDLGPEASPIPALGRGRFGAPSSGTAWVFVRKRRRRQKRG